VEYLGSLEGNSVELDIHLKLVSLDTEGLLNLHEPYLCFRPTLLVKQLREYVARHLKLKAEEVELLVSKDGDTVIGNKTSTEKMQSLQDDETVAKLKVDCISSNGYMIVVYRRKQIA
jgi:E3 ubiquitin-protein ligase RNF1/2